MLSSILVSMAMLGSPCTPAACAPAACAPAACATAEKVREVRAPVRKIVTALASIHENRKETRTVRGEERKAKRACAPAACAPAACAKRVARVERVREVKVREAKIVKVERRRHKEPKACAPAACAQTAPTGPAISPAPPVPGK